MSQLQK
jgi:hypothetical protein